MVTWRAIWRSMRKPLADKELYTVRADVGIGPYGGTDPSTPLRFAQDDSGKTNMGRWRMGMRVRKHSGREQVRLLFCPPGGYGSPPP